MATHDRLLQAAPGQLSGLRIDYSDLRRALTKARRWSRRRRVLGVARALAFWAALAFLPFFLLIRGGVFLYRTWGLGTWSSLLLAAVATAWLLGMYAWRASRRIGARKGTRRRIARGAFGVSLAYVAYALVFVASENVKSEDVRAEYRSLHPLLRVASSALILADPAAVVTDAGRTAQDYRRMGLGPVEASLHFRQASGYVHALDLRTEGRAEVRNLGIQLVFWLLGFQTLRHVGTADHLHVSLGTPG